MYIWESGAILQAYSLLFGIRGSAPIRHIAPNFIKGELSGLPVLAKFSSDKTSAGLRRVKIYIRSIVLAFA
jgi:hypothetical protein